MWSNAAYRGYSKGLIDRSAQSGAWQGMDAARDGRTQHSCFLTLSPEGRVHAQTSRTRWPTGTRSTPTIPNANPLGLMDSGPVYSVNGGKRNGVAPWQHNFFTWSAGHAAELGFAGAARISQLAGQVRDRLDDRLAERTHQGYCWLEASAYSIQVKDAAGNWLPSYTRRVCRDVPDARRADLQLAGHGGRPWECEEATLAAG